MNKAQISNTIISYNIMLQIILSSDYMYLYMVQTSTQFSVIHRSLSGSTNKQN